MPGFRTQLGRNFVAGPAAAAVSSLVAVGVYPFYLRSLGYEQYGVWLVLSTVLMVVQLTNLGIGPAVTVTVAQRMAANDLDGFQKYSSTALALTWLIGGAVAIAVFGSREAIAAVVSRADGLQSETARLLVPMAAISGYALVVQVFTSALCGLGRMDLTVASEAAGRVVGAGTSVALLLAGFGVWSLIVGSLANLAVVHGLAAHACRSLTGGKLFSLGRVDRIVAAELLRVGLPVFGATLITAATHPVNRIVLARYAGLASVPVYDIAYSATMHARALVESSFRSLGPAVAEAVGKAEGFRVVQGYLRGSRLVVWGIALPGFAAAYTFARPLFAMWLGSAFDESIVSVFRALCVGGFINVAGMPSHHVLLGLARGSAIFAAKCATAAANALAIMAAALVAGGISSLGVGMAAAAGLVVGAVVSIAAADKALRAKMEATSEMCALNPHGC